MRDFFLWPIPFLFLTAEYLAPIMYVAIGVALGLGLAVIL